MIKINGNWKYCHTLLDMISNYVVVDAFYDTGDKTTITEFLNESTTNKNKIAITTDLDKKYSLIILKLGFKHQLCIFILNIDLKDFKDKYLGV